MSFSLVPRHAAADDQNVKSWVRIHTPVDDKFLNAFETRVSDDVAAWTSELEEFYSTDGKLVYRGMCNDAGQKLVDFLHMFVSVNTNLLSQAVYNAHQQSLEKPGAFDLLKNDFHLRRSIFADFSRYNRDANLYSLYTETNIHQLGPVPGNEAAYKQSYGFSTSWSFWAATEFSGVYPGDTPCANSMVFGMYPANNFIDYVSLDAADYRFKQLYPDEREILGVGGVDPDSLMMAVRLEGRNTDHPVITEMLFRDPMNPGQILYFDGGIDAIDAEVKEGWALLKADESGSDATFREHNVWPPTPPSIPPDSTFRLPLGHALVVNYNDAPREPIKVIPLDYSLALFPEQPVPVGQ